MASTAQHQQHPGTSSLAKLTKGGFGFSSSHRGSKNGGDGKKDGKGRGEDADEWYIPYNGPYEAPRAPSPRRQRARDSWGDPLDDYARAIGGSSSNADTDEEEDIAQRLADMDSRYGYDYAQGHGQGRGHRRGGVNGSTGSALSGTETLSSRYMSDDPDLTVRGRNMQRGRAGSVVSGHTSSSAGAQDPSRAAAFAPRYSPAMPSTAPGPGPSRPSHLSLSAVGGGFALGVGGAGGGVGESPVPSRRRFGAAGGDSGNRISFASIFSGFSGIGGLTNSSSGAKSHRRGDSSGSAGNGNGNGGKQQWGPLSLARSNTVTSSSDSSYARKAPPLAPLESPRRAVTNTTNTTTTTNANFLQGASTSTTTNTRPARPETETLTINSRTVHAAVQERIDSLETDDEEYYNSYYSTLMQASPTIKGKGRGTGYGVAAVQNSPPPPVRTVKKQSSLPLPQPAARGAHRHTPSNSGESSSNVSNTARLQPRAYPSHQYQAQQAPLSHSNPHSNPNSNSPSLSRQNSNTNSNTSRSTPSRQGSTSSNSNSNPNSYSNARPHPYAAAYVFPSSSVIPAATVSYAAQAYVPRTAAYNTNTNTNTNANATPPTVTLSSPTTHPSSADAAHLAFSPRDPRARPGPGLGDPQQQRTAGGGLGFGMGMGLLRSLKNSISTPDLRASLAAASSSPPEGAAAEGAIGKEKEKGKGTPQKPAPTFVFPKGKERWLSAETWCDAVLFPRPRLKVKQELLAGGTAGATVRNMSPPGTPITPASAFDHDDDDDDDDAEEGRGKSRRRARKPSVRESAIASRVLAYSRSLVDLGKERGKEKEKEVGKGKARAQNRPRAQTNVGASGSGAQGTYASHGVPPAPLRKERQMIPQVHVRPPEQEREAGTLSSAAGGSSQGQVARPPRPKSWAWDDLALPSPVPSLARVLHEGEMLDAQRREWQRQAKSSFGNKHSRSLSRNRSQTVTQGRARLRHPAGHHHQQSSLEYLAAQACLGAQNLSPPIAPRAFNFAGVASSSHESSSYGHSHSSSLAKTTTSKSSQSQSHSRNTSWSKGAMKLAKSTVVCGVSTSPTSSSSSAGQHYPPPGDLEGALKTQNTKVIRLADPAQVPVDDPTSPAVRYTPSPAFSALSESKVGIAIGTPPAEATFDYSLPSHPYAAGGLSISHPAGTNVYDERTPFDHVGAHPIGSSAVGKPPGMSDIAARHKLPPQLAVHPYAQTSSNRDSYIDSHGLIGQHRSDANVPHPSKMWAQLSPGVVREILPGDIEYSPFMSEDGDRGSPVVSNRNTVMINDTIGVGETLVNAVARLRESKDSGLGTSEGHNGAPGSSKAAGGNSRTPWLHDPEHNVLPSFTSTGLRGPNHGPVINLYAPDTLGDFSEDNQYPHQDVEQLLVSASRELSHSPAITSESSSPHTSPQPLGSPHDLDGFQDLFYRPSALPVERTPHEAALPDTPHAWASMNVRHHSRTGSGLTSLARQLTDEFEQIADDFRDSSLQYTPRSGPVSSTGTTMGSSRGPSVARRPTNGSFPFVFEEVEGEAPAPARPIQDSPLQAFKASDTLPEDVLSSRASSFMEPEDDEENTARYRVGMVESVATPPITSSEHRLSFAVQTTVAQGNTGEQVLLSPSHPPLRSPTDSRNSRSRRQILSSLQTPTSDATRSSYVTTASDLSRMSGLSAFPVPPKGHDTRSPSVSLLSTYFNNDTTLMSSDPSPLGAPGSSAASLVQEERVTFGRNQNADDLAKTLSSPARFDPPVPF